MTTKRAHLTELRWTKGRPDGVARVYRCDPPMPWRKYGVGEDRTAEYVIVSAVPHVLVGDPETYIFPASIGPDGVDVDDWGELDGSYRGGMDHEEALRGAGYEVIR